MSAAFQYYQPLVNVQPLVTYLQQNACAANNAACRDHMADLSWATSIDFDFDAISHALQVNAVWAHGPEGGRWHETIYLQDPSDSVEVGVLNSEKPTEPEELSLGGFLTVLGEDSKPSEFEAIKPKPAIINKSIRRNPLLFPIQTPPLAPKRLDDF